MAAVHECIDFKSMHSWTAPGTIHRPNSAFNEGDANIFDKCTYSDAAVSEHDIVGLCDLYSLETAQVVRELREFRNVYSTLKDLVKIDDLIIKTKGGTNKATNKAKNDVKDDNGNVADTENNDDELMIMKFSKSMMMIPMTMIKQQRTDG